MATDQQIIADAKKQFELASEVEHDNRVQALDDIRFSALSQMWPEAARLQREKENRPCLTTNKINPIIKQITNDARQNKPAIKVHPADDNSDPLTAQIYNGLIRNIEYTSNADIAYDTALEFAVRGGFGYWMVALEHADDDTFDLDIKIKPVYNPFSVYGDPHSVEADGSDWNVAFVVDQMSRDEFKKKWKGANPVDWEALGYSAGNAPWVQKDEIQVAEYWTRNEVWKTIVQLSDGTILTDAEYAANKDLIDMLPGPDGQPLTVKQTRKVMSYKVTQRIITGAEVLETNDWVGKYIPICPVYGNEINIEGRRYFSGIVRDLKDPQRMYNVARSATVEILMQSPKTPFIGPTGAFNSANQKWQQANTNAYPYIEYDGQIPPQRQPYAGPPAGLIQETMQAADDIKAVSGLYDASMGAQGNEIAARAILARQKEGDTSTFNYIDNVSRAIRHTGRILIDLVPQVYSGQRMVRILGESGRDPQVVRLGTPETLPNGDVKIYDLSAGKYDLTVETGPSFTTRREETANQMIDLIQAFPQIAPYITDLLARALDWPEADEIANRAKALLPPAIQGQNPQLQQAQNAINALKVQLQQSQQEVTSLKMDKVLEADKLKIDAYSAETDRLKIEQTMMSPDQVQALILQTLQQVLYSPNPNPEPPSMAIAPPSVGAVAGPVPHDPLSRSNPEQPRLDVPS